MNLLLLAFLAAVSAAQARPAAQAPAGRQQGAPRPAPTQPAAPPASSDAVAPDYRIAPGDVLQVFVWKEPDLSRDVRVRPDGNVTIALVGDVFAAGKTLKGLAAELSEALGRFVTTPVVTATLGESSSLRFYVIGEVNKPGEFPLIGRVTVMQALAIAGGFREYAKSDELKLLRQEQSVVAGRQQTRESAVSINYKALAQGQSLQQNLVLKPGDVIVVP